VISVSVSVAIAAAPGCPTTSGSGCNYLCQFKTVVFCQLLEAHSGAILDGVCIASIGPQTSKTCVSLLEWIAQKQKEYYVEANP